MKNKRTDKLIEDLNTFFKYKKFKVEVEGYLGVDEKYLEADDERYVGITKNNSCYFDWEYQMKLKMNIKNYLNIF